MARNLDLTAIRAFVMVAELGGVTRAAGLLNLTQSAVSMQIKRLEEALGVQLFLRASRKLVPSPEGEQLLSYGRRMLALNDEVVARLGTESYEGEIRLGVPHDIVYPAIPQILKRMAQTYPRVRINLISSMTLEMKQSFAKGGFDVIVTTEIDPDPQGEVLGVRPLVWVGAPEGNAFQRRPLRLGFKDNCIFRPRAQQALDAAGIAWELASGGESELAIEAMIAADLAVAARMLGAFPTGLVALIGDNSLPVLGEMKVAAYCAEGRRDAVIDLLMAELRCAYGSLGSAATALEAGRAA